MTQSSSPKVSICIPVYNGLPYIETTIESILAQSLTDYEVLIRDDRSTDGTFEWLQQRFGSDPRFRLKQNGTNLDVGGQYNLLFSEARGEFILKLDADDIIMPDMLDRLVVIAESSGAGFVGAGYERLSMSSGTRQRPSVQLGLKDGPVADPVRVVLSDNPFHLCFSIWRRSLLPAMQRDGQFVLFTETCDWECQLRIALTGTPFVAVTEVLGLYRLHDTNRSRIENVQLRSMVGDVVPYWREALVAAIGRRRFQNWIMRLLADYLKLTVRRPSSFDAKIITDTVRILIARPILPTWCLSDTWRADLDKGRP